MSIEDRYECIRKLNQLTISLSIHRESPIQSLDDVEVPDIIEIYRLICGLSAEDSTLIGSSSEVVNHMLTYLKKRFAPDGSEFNYLNYERIVDKDVGQLLFLLQIFEQIHSHKLKSRRASKRTSRASTTLTSLTNSSVRDSSNAPTISSNLTSDAEDTSFGTTSGPESSKEKSNDPQDSTIISDSGRSTALSDETDLNSTHSTIDKIVVNVGEDSVVSESEEEHLSTQNGTSNTGALKRPSNTQFTSSKINFDKDQMLMIGHRSGSKQGSRQYENILSVSAIDGTNEKPKNVELSLLDSFAKALSNPPKRNTKSKIKPPTEVLTSRSGDLGTSQIKTAPEEVLTLESNRSLGTLNTNEEPSDTEHTDTIEEAVATVVSLSKNSVEITNTHEVSDTEEESETMEGEGVSVGIGNETLIGDDSHFEYETEEDEESIVDIDDYSAEGPADTIDSGHLAVQSLLKDYLNELEHQIKDLKSRKGSSIKSTSQYSKFKSPHKYDHFGKSVKQKFPYYPYGIIHPKCKSIMGSGTKGPPKPRKPFQNNFNNLQCGIDTEEDTRIPSTSRTSKTSKTSKSSSSQPFVTGLASSSDPRSKTTSSQARYVGE